MTRGRAQRAPALETAIGSRTGRLALGARMEAATTSSASCHVDSETKR